MINIPTEDLISLYKSGKSSIQIAKMLGTTKWIILKKLQKIPDWNLIKRIPHRQKKEIQLIESVCTICNSTIKKNKKVKYCSSKCCKQAWINSNPDYKKTKEFKSKRQEKRKVKIKKETERQKWIIKFEKMLIKHHKNNIKKLAIKLVNKSVSIKNSMITRSKKSNVKCDITIEDIRALILDKYGTPCKYNSDKIIDHHNMTFDHIVPISKGGESTKNNIQLITRFSNNVKGSLDEKSLYVLLNWLETIDSELKKDILIRLAKGLH